MKISVHEFVHNVHVVEVLFQRRSYDVFDCNHLLRYEKNSIRFILQKHSRIHTVHKIEQRLRHVVLTLS